MWGSDRLDERSVSRRPLTVVLTFGLVTVVLLGSWMVLKPASGPVLPGSAGVTATEPTGATAPPDVRAYARELTPGELTTAQALAQQQNLEMQDLEPNPFVTAIREAVGPEMSEEDLQQLSQTVNLLCQSSEQADEEGVANLMENGMSSATAKALIAACSIP